MDKKQGVAVFVLVGKEPEGGVSMEFYGFDEIFGRIFDDDVSPNKDDAASFGAQPFAGFNSRPLNCRFISTRGHIFVIGGSLLSSHLKHRLCGEYHLLLERHALDLDRGDRIDLDLDQLTRILDGEYPLGKLYSLPRHDFEYMTSNTCTRVHALHIQGLVNSLFDNNNNNNKQKREKIKAPFVKIDYEEEDESGFWKTCSPLTTPRSCHVVSLGGGLLLAVGGNRNRNRATTTTDPFLEFSLAPTSSPWLPLRVIDPRDGAPKFTHTTLFLLVAIKRCGLLLIGSNGMFYSLPILPIHPTLPIPAFPINIECPSEFIEHCCAQPGIVVDESKDWAETIVVWYDGGSFCIRGLHLGQGHYFSIDIMDTIFEYDHDIHVTTKLIGFGDGRLAFVYTGRDGYSFFDEEGVLHVLSEYRCVTFEIIYESPSSPPTPSYPGIWLNTKIISTRKCYAPWMKLEAAFVMDVCFPSQDSATGETEMHHDILIKQWKNVLNSTDGEGITSTPLNITDKLFELRDEPPKSKEAMAARKPVNEAAAVLIHAYEEELARLENEIQAKKTRVMELHTKIEELCVPTTSSANDTSTSTPSIHA